MGSQEIHLNCIMAVATFMLLVGRSFSPQPPLKTQSACVSAPERERLLCLDQEAFDQDVSQGGGGWRAIGNKPGCDMAAADLIRDYRVKHGATETILFWHEGQLRAFAGAYPEAIALFQQSRKPEAQNAGGWNAYVDASIAFLQGDRGRLVEAREALAMTPAVEGFVVKDGVFEIPNNSGSPIKMRWPPNIDVVDGLIRCFGKTYTTAYSSPECRPAAPQ